MWAAVAVWRKAGVATNGRRLLHWLVQSTIHRSNLRFSPVCQFTALTPYGPFQESDSCGRGSPRLRGGRIRLNKKRQSKIVSSMGKSTFWHNTVLSKQCRPAGSVIKTYQDLLGLSNITRLNTQCNRNQRHSAPCVKMTFRKNLQLVTPIQECYYSSCKKQVVII